MALLTNCPNCGNQIVNNGQDCPFCGYSIKDGKTREEIEQEALEAEEAKAAEEAAAKAEAEAKAAEEAARAEAEARAAEEAARAEAEARAAAEAAKAAAEARAAAEAAQAQKQSSNIFSKFQKKTTVQNNSNTDLEKKINEKEKLPEIPAGKSGKKLPPIEIERPVPLSKIANTPAVPLEPLAKEKVKNQLPPMQPEREISVEEIKNTQAVPLKPIKAEEIHNALPTDTASPKSEKKQPQITVEVPETVPTTPIHKNAPPIRPQQPTAPVQEPVQTPAPPQPPVQQEPPAPQQRPQRQPRPQNPQNGGRPQQKQWSSEPQDFSGNGQEPSQNAPQQRPQRQPRPQNPQNGSRPQQQRPPRQQKQWSSEPQDFGNGQEPSQNAPQQRPQRQSRPQNPQNGGRPQQQRPPRQQRQWSSNPQGGKTVLDPIVQERQDVSPTGERLENLPPQQVASDPNFDTDSYVQNLQRQIQNDQANTQREIHKDDVVKKAENVEVQPMKFDGKQLRGANVSVVTAPSKSKNLILPITIVIILIIALIVIAVVMLSGNGSESTETSGDTSTSASASTSTTKAGRNVTFEKPADWGNDVYAYVYVLDPNGDDAKKLAVWPGEKMQNDGNGKYSYTVDGDYVDGLIIFNDGKDGGHQYPDKNEDGVKIVAGQTYKVS